MKKLLALLLLLASAGFADPLSFHIPLVGSSGGGGTSGSISISAGQVGFGTGINAIGGDAGLTYSGGTLTATHFVGDGSGLTGVGGGGSPSWTSIIGVPSGVANISNSTGSVTVTTVNATTGTFTNIAGTLSTANQSNVTGLGTIASLSAGSIAATGNITGSPLISTSINGTVSGTFGYFRYVSGSTASIGTAGFGSTATSGAANVSGTITAQNITVLGTCTNCGAGGGSSGTPSFTYITISKTWVVPTGVTWVKATVTGGGGGGGGCNGTACAGGGGAGSPTGVKTFTGLSAGQSVTATIGLGGLGGFNRWEQRFGWYGQLTSRLRDNLRRLRKRCDCCCWQHEYHGGIQQRRSCLRRDWGRNGLLLCRSTGRCRYWSGRWYDAAGLRRRFLLGHGRLFAQWYELRV